MSARTGATNSSGGSAVNNSLHGTLPAAFSRWTNVSSLYFQENSFTGATAQSACFCLVALVQRLLPGDLIRADRCIVEGTLPPAWSALTQLQMLSFRNNRLSGEPVSNHLRLDNWFEFIWTRMPVPSKSTRWDKMFLNLNLTKSIRVCDVPALIYVPFTHMHSTSHHVVEKSLFSDGRHCLDSLVCTSPGL